MTGQVIEVGEALNITATNSTLKDVMLMGLFVSQNSTGTIKVADASKTIANTFTPLPGQYYQLPCRTTGAVTVTITGTMDVTVFYRN